MKAMQPVDTIVARLETPQMKNQLLAALPRHVTPERMVRLCRTMLQTTPKIAACEPGSIFACIVEASQLGLEPNSPLQHCWLIPFYHSKSKQTFAQLQLGYRGLLELVRRSGRVKGIYAEVVYEKDQFNAELGTVQRITHQPYEGGDPGALRAVYAVAGFSDGGYQFGVAWRRDIEKVKKASQASGKPDSPWIKWEAEMWRKTALKRLCKYLPQSVERPEEVAQALSNDDAADLGRQQVFSTAAFEAPQLPDTSATDAVRERIEAAKGTPAAESDEASPEELDELFALVKRRTPSEMDAVAKLVACKDVDAMLALTGAQLVRTAIRHIEELHPQA